MTKRMFLNAAMVLLALSVCSLTQAGAEAVQTQSCPRCEGLPPDIQVRLMQYCLLRPTDQICKPYAVLSLDSSVKDYKVPPIPRAFFELDQPPVWVAPFLVRPSECPPCVGQDFALQLKSIEYCVLLRLGRVELGLLDAEQFAFCKR
jgi:hypothetical protein